jgi:heterodisulfide reductase subunit C
MANEPSLIRVDPEQINLSFVDRVNEASGQVVQRCYYCFKCTAGCPITPFMDYGPDRVLRMVQLGLKDRLMTSSTIWLCAACEACATRCPNDIEIARVMDALRQMALDEGYPVGEKTISDFHHLYLALIKRFGRMHEASLMGIHKLRSGDLFSDVGAGMRLFFMGKLPLFPHRIKGVKEIEAIFDKTMKRAPR